MLDAYSCDPLGDGKPLAEDVRENLAARLAKVPNALAWLVRDGENPVGVLTAFVGFSTFSARPLINIHDVSVIAEYRGQGLARKLLEEVEAHARRIGCCALTLEVLGNNVPAQNAYRRFGFEGAGELNPPTAMAFWKKKLE